MTSRQVALIFGLTTAVLASGVSAQSGLIDANENGQTITVETGTTLTARSSDGWVIGSDYDDVDIIVESGGTVRATGSQQNGIDIYQNGINAEIDVNTGGLVETTGFLSSAIVTQGINTQITVAGTVRTTGFQSLGIDSMREGADIDINDGGVVETTGGGTSHGIWVQGMDAEIDVNSGGRVVTAADDVSSIHSTSRNADIAVNEGGRVESTGSGSYGISIHANDATVTVAGIIMTTGANAHGINVEERSEGKRADIDILTGGLIETSGTGAHGISAGGGRPSTQHGGVDAGTDAEITVAGRIVTRGDNSHGIESQGANADIDINTGGVIDTFGAGAHGISAGGGDYGIDAEVTVAGRIETRGANSRGLLSEGLRADIDVNEGGEIKTAGENAHGIESEGDDADIDINEGGTIMTAGMAAHGIDSRGANADIAVNEGSIILTTGASAHGIDSSGMSATIAANGAIMTAGAGSHGISSSGTGNTVTVNGVIMTTGAGSHGIYAMGGDESITVGGTIVATGADSFAILGTGSGGQTLTLLSSARVQGRIGGFASVDVGAFGGHREASSVLLIEGATTVMSESLVGGTQIVLESNVDETYMLAALDPSASALQRDALARVSHLVHNAVHNQSSLRHRGSFERQGWAMAIGSDYERDGSGAALDWEGDIYGLVGGVESTLASGARFGVVAAFARSDVETETASIDVDAKTAMLGIYGKKESLADAGGVWDLTGTLLGGYNDFDTDRLVVGSVRKVARGSHKGWFASASVGARLSRPISERVEFRPSIHINGLISRHRSYSEDGAGSANLDYDSWTSVSGNGRLQLAIATIGANAELEVRAGATTRLHHDDDVTARLVLGGDPVNYDVPGDDSVSGGFVGARLTSTQSERFSLVADAEYGRGDNDEEAISFNLHLSALF